MSWYLEMSKDEISEYLRNNNMIKIINEGNTLRPEVSYILSAFMQEYEVEDEEVKEEEEEPEK